MKSVRVDLADRSYEVVVGQDLISRAASYLPPGEHEKLVVIADQSVDSLYGDALAASLSGVGEVLRLPVASGEPSKAWAVAGRLLESLAGLKVRRHDVILTLGGGMVCDLGGFVASVYQRGIALVHVPTTLLAQVDAAIGGKTGVNLSAGKNLAGTFYQPSAVIADVSALETLSRRQFRSGMAEVVKYSLCYDPSMISAIRAVSAGGESPPSDEGKTTRSPDGAGEPGAEGSSTPRRDDLLEDLVTRCVAIKAKVVAEDELDQSGRIILNYGHTFGHALEAAGGYRRWLHGEAISIGMVFAARVAAEMGLLSDGDADLHSGLLREVGLPVEARFDPDRITRAWGIDKKHQKVQRWVLLEGLGKPAVRTDVAPKHLHAGLEAVLTGARRARS